MHTRLWPALLALGIPLAQAQFHDEGMTRPPVVRTDYGDPTAGTSANPVVLGTCLWGNCRPERTVFAQSNYWRQNWPCEGCAEAPLRAPHWTLILNNEPRADPGNSGPPDASLPRAAPGSGLMGFATLQGDANMPGDPFWRAHLALDFLPFDNPVFGGIPFLGFGEFSSRTGRPIGYLQPSSRERPSVLAFAARLWAAYPPTPIPGGTQPAVLVSWLWVAADWGTRPKAIFLTLYHFNLQNSVPPGDPAIGRFNWPMAESVFYPGAEIVYIDAEDLDDYCGFPAPLLVQGQDIKYDVDLTALYRCVDGHGWFTEPMPPAADIPVTQVLWANESTGLDGAIWTDVHDPRMHAPRTPAADAAPTAPGGYGTATASIRQALERQCGAIPGCAERAALAAEGREFLLELPIDRQPSRPELLRTVRPAPQ